MRRNRVLEVVAGLACAVGAPLCRAAWITVPNASDMVYDDRRGLLYVITSSGQIARYNPATGTTLPAWNVGVNPRAADITRDGKYLLLAEGSAGAAQGVIRRVNLDTGVNTNLFYDLLGEGAGASDIAVMNDGTAIFTTSHQFSGAPITLRRVDLTNWTIGPFVVDGVTHTFERGSPVFRSRDGSTVLLTGGNTSAGPMQVYSTRAGDWIVARGMGTHLNYMTAGFSPDGRVMAWAGANIGSSVQHTADLSLIEVFQSLHGGIAFDPSGTLMYAGNVNDKKIHVYRTGTYQEIASFPSEADFWLLEGAPLQISEDGRWLFFRNGEAVRSVAIDPVRPTVADLNGDGTVNISDYFLIDRGAAMGLEGFANGDIDGNGVIDAGDYYTMDWAFRKIHGGGAAALVGAAQSIPEPGGAIAVAMGAALAGGRRRAKTISPGRCCSPA
jgi:WD40 repeat protein